MAMRVEAVPASAPSRYDLHRGHVAWATVVFFCTFGGQAIRAAFGFWGWGAAILIALVASLVWLIRAGRRYRADAAAGRRAAATRGDSATRRDSAAVTAADPASTATPRQAPASLARAARSALTPSALLTPYPARIWLTLPVPFLIFGIYATISTAWSQWPLETLLGSAVLWTTVLVAAPLALLMSWEELVVALSGAVRWIVALSFVFELVVSLVIRHPILPVFITGTDWSDAPLQWLWSRNELFDDGKIQGIVGNSTVLGEVAAYGLIALVVQRAAKLISWGGFAFWGAVLVGTLALTRSATMAVALVVVAAVLVIVLVRRRMTTRRSVVTFWAVVVAAVALTAVLVEALWSVILGLLGKSDDFTGRFEIWANTIGLAVQRPAFGWGWLGYWPPWVEPLGHLNERYGTYLLQAHDAWIDLWMQVGIVGLVLFAIMVAQVLWRAYRAATTRTTDAETGVHGFTGVSLFPLLLLTALLVQSITESRLLVEDGMIALVILALGLAVKPFRPPSALRPTRRTERIDAETVAAVAAAGAWTDSSEAAPRVPTVPPVPGRTDLDDAAPSDGTASGVAPAAELDRTADASASASAPPPAPTPPPAPAS